MPAYKFLWVKPTPIIYHLARRLVLLPEAVRRVLQSVEDDFVSKVKQFLNAEFKST